MRCAFVPRFRATSTRRLELELFSEPTTSSRSASEATCLTPTWRVHVDLGHKRTRRINHPQTTGGAGFPDFGRNSVSAVNYTLAIRNFLDTVDENCALALQLFHHKTVMDNLLAHINRRTKRLKRDADNINSPHHSRAKPPRFQEK